MSISGVKFFIYPHRGGYGVKCSSDSLMVSDIAKKISGKNTIPRYGAKIYVERRYNCNVFTTTTNVGEPTERKYSTCCLRIKADDCSINDMLATYYNRKDYSQYWADLLSTVVSDDGSSINWIRDKGYIKTIC